MFFLALVFGSNFVLTWVISIDCACAAIEKQALVLLIHS